MERRLRRCVLSTNALTRAHVTRRWPPLFSLVLIFVSVSSCLAARLKVSRTANWLCQLAASSALVVVARRVSSQSGLIETLIGGGDALRCALLVNVNAPTSKRQLNLVATSWRTLPRPPPSPPPPHPRRARTSALVDERQLARPGLWDGRRRLWDDEGPAIWMRGHAATRVCCAPLMQSGPRFCSLLRLRSRDSRRRRRQRY
jgi:hypothetical protein